MVATQFDKFRFDEFCRGYIVKSQFCLKFNSTEAGPKYKVRPNLSFQTETVTSRTSYLRLAMSALGIYEASSDTILNMMNDLGIAKSVQISIIKKIMNIAVRSTYYIFCRRNKAWTDPALLHF